MKQTLRRVLHAAGRLVSLRRWGQLGSRLLSRHRSFPFHKDLLGQHSKSPLQNLKDVARLALFSDFVMSSFTDRQGVQFSVPPTTEGSFSFPAEDVKINDQRESENAHAAAEGNTACLGAAAMETTLQSPEPGESSEPLSFHSTRSRQTHRSCSDQKSLISAVFSLVCKRPE